MDKIKIWHIMSKIIWFFIWPTDGGIIWYHTWTTRRSIMQRPTSRELHGKVADAIQALKFGRHTLTQSVLKHWLEDGQALGLDATSELWPLLVEFLEEIKQSQPDKCYTGRHPPMECYESDRAINGEDLWAFSWFSLKFNKQMYLKFVLKKNRQGEWHYYHIDCHTSRKR